jgi:hypothetical protein
MKLKIALLTAIISILASPAHSTSPVDARSDFEISFGPWSNTHSSNYRKRTVFLNVLGNVLDTCVESKWDNKSDILLSCPFIKPDKNAGWVLDKEVAITLLYHDLGMNRDGSKRYFWHEWLDII